ncbi:MAG: SDR family NAD(P)-dependent oxidoreductase, partial [Bryobacterales bacterium]|nr:SDR family NAD(P)-dependent oxidoreductase [Bryobacterales bacterium]
MERINETLEFAGKRVLVTGGTRGIGAAVVKRLKAGGATVLATARSVPPGDHDDSFLAADGSSAEGAERVIRTTLERLGGLDILINSVGGSTTPAGGV